LWFTLGPRETRETLSLPGSGLSYTETQRIHHAPATVAAALPIDEPGRPSELLASLAGSDAAPASSSSGSSALIWLVVVLALVLVVIGIWVLRMILL
jgi:hypothetical protein